MSLRGRYVIDRIKSAVQHRFTLPCPPYGMPTYWEGVYKKLGPDDVYEWGATSLRDVLEYRYDATLFAEELKRFGYTSTQDDQMVLGAGIDTIDMVKEQQDEYIETTFGESIGIHPDLLDKDDESSASYGDKKRILLLGCGNSKFGEDMLASGWSGQIIQADVSQRVVTTMTERCRSFVSDGTMEIVQDDATTLTAFENGAIDCCVDKGMMDALFCASRPDQLMDVMKSVNRVLVPGGIYTFFSFSRPEFLLGQLLHGGDENEQDNRGRDAHNNIVPERNKRRNHIGMNKKMWEDVQVRALDHMLLYRFVKAQENFEDEEDEDRAMRVERQKRQRMQRRIN